MNCTHPIIEKGNGEVVFCVICRKNLGKVSYLVWKSLDYNLILREIEKHKEVIYAPAKTTA